MEFLFDDFFDCLLIADMFLLCENEIKTKWVILVYDFHPDKSN